MYVIKTGGAVVARPESARMLAEAWHDRDEDWVLVHGGGPQLDMALRAVQGPPKKVAGLRVTTEAGAEAVRRTLSLIGADLAAKLKEHGVPARHIPPEEHIMVAVPKNVKEGDLGRVGTVTAVRSELIQDTLAAGELPVVTPVGWDATGPLNVNADEGASVTAMAIGANRLVLATDVDAVMDGKGRSLSSVDVGAARALIRDGVAVGGMHAKLDQAMEAVEAGVDEVRIGPVSTAWDETIGTAVVPREPEVATTGSRTRARRPRS